MLTELRPAATLRPSNMAEAFIKAIDRRESRYATTKRVLRSIEKPGVGLIDNNTGRPAPTRKVTK